MSESGKKQVMCSLMNHVTDGVCLISLETLEVKTVEIIYQVSTIFPHLLSIYRSSPKNIYIFKVLSSSPTSLIRLSTFHFAN